MKFRITFKDPDAVHYALEDISMENHKQCQRAAEKFFEYGEYVVIEIDTVKGTAKVLPVKS